MRSCRLSGYDTDHANPSIHLPVPLIFNATQRSWPKHGETARRVPYLPLALALRRRFPHDAHTAAYSTPTLPRRLSAGALLAPGKAQLPAGVPMVLAVFDVDCEASHKASGGEGGAPASDMWWQGQMAKLKVLAQVHPDLFAYRTRGGYRLVYILPEPHLLRSPDDAALWSWCNLTWCAYLARRFDIQADSSCKDWPRLYRLPHATRTAGGRSEERETRGDPRRIGVWHCDSTDADVITAQTLCKRQRPCRRERTRTRHASTPSLERSAPEGVLYHAFQARGWLGPAIEPGKWAVACPWEDQHTKGERFDTSTILFAPGNGDTLGWLHCSHAHCQSCDIRDVLAIFSAAELDRAKDTCGAPQSPFRTVPAENLMGWRHQAVPAQELTAWRQQRMAAEEVDAWRK